MPYPAAWGPIPPPPADDCHHFEGNYRNHGETIPGEEEFPLAWVFTTNPSDDVALTQATRVSLSLPTDDVLKVAVWEGIKPLFTRTLDRPKNFTCEAGRLVIRWGTSVGSDLGVEWFRIAMTLTTTDDHLVAQVKTSDFALAFLVVPLSAKKTRWYRYQRERDD